MAAAVILVFVALGDAEDPATRAMTRTTQEVLGDPAIVLVREVAKMPSDDDAVTLEGALQASAVVELEWSVPDRRVAHLRVHGYDGTWSERSIPFTTSDAPSERGRALAFAISSMVPSVPRLVSPAKPSPPEPVVVASAPPTPSPVAMPVDAPRAPSPFAIEALAHVATGAAAEGGATGGSLALSYRPAWLGVRLSSAARVGAVSVAGATSTAFRIGAGPTLAFPVVSWLRVGGRLEATALRIELSRGSFEETPASRASRWVPGAVLAFETMLESSSGGAVVAAFGLEHTFAITNVAVSGERVGALPRTRAIFELGVRLRW